MPLAMTAEAALITNAPVSNDNERIRFSIDQHGINPLGGLNDRLESLPYQDQSSR